MKTTTITLGIIAISLGYLSPIASAQFSGSSSRTSKSSLNNDPEVLELENFSTPIQLLLVADTAIYASKSGNRSRKLGTLTSGSSVQLIAMTENVYRISGKGKYGKLKGWVSPRSLASKDPDFVENLKKLYQRQIKVNEFIANKQVAIGMTIKEVKQALGQPTKKEATITKDGSSGTYQYIQNEQEKHYRYVSDHLTGQIFKQLSHVTTIEKSNTSIDFVNDVVTAIITKDNNSEREINSIAPPIYFR